MRRKQIHCSEMAAYLCENMTEGLNSPQCLALRKHLAGCPNCTAYLDSLRKTVYLFKTVRDPHLPRTLRRKLHSVVRLQTPVARKSGKKR